MGYYQIDVSPTSRQLSTEVLSYSKRQCQSLISPENRARIFDSWITRAGAQPLELRAQARSLSPNKSFEATKNIAIYMCSTRRRPHT
jgi:hypothetical protein